MPEAPKTDICIVSIVHGGCRCINVIDSSLYTLTYEECDKFRAMSPVNAEAWDLYVANLEREVKECRNR